MKNPMKQLLSLAALIVWLSASLSSTATASREAIGPVSSTSPMNSIAQEPDFQFFVATDYYSGAAIYYLSNSRRWQKVLDLKTPSTNYLEFAYFGGKLYASTKGVNKEEHGQGLYSTRNGLTWVSDSGFPGRSVFGLSVADDRLYAGARGGFYQVRTNGSGSFSRFPPTYGVIGYQVAALHGTLYATTQDGLYTSTNEGRTWKKLQAPGLPFGPNIIEFQDKLFILQGSSLYESEDGTTWQQMKTAPVIRVGPVIFNDLLLASDGGKLYQSLDGMTWEEVEMSPPAQVLLVAKGDSGDRLCVLGPSGLFDKFFNIVVF